MNMTVWRSLVEDPPPPGCKFIALFNDGSGSGMFFRHDGGYIDSDGDEYSDLNLESYDLWIELPQGKEFWCELRSEDPMTLTSSIGIPKC